MCMQRFVAVALLCWLSCFAAAQENLPTDKFQLRTFETTKLSDRFFAEGATFGDLNHDKIADLIAGPFWFAGPDFKQQHMYYAAKPFDPNGYSDNFFAYVCDFNGDGLKDIVTGKRYWAHGPKGYPRARCTGGGVLVRIEAG